MSTRPLHFPRQAAHSSPFRLPNWILHACSRFGPQWQDRSRMRSLKQPSEAWKRDGWVGEDLHKAGLIQLAIKMYILKTLQTATSSDARIISVNRRLRCYIYKYTYISRWDIGTLGTTKYKS